MGKIKAVITSTGSYFPERIVDNHYFESYLDTSDEWITTRTGIKTRRFLEDGKATSDMAVEAAKVALERRGITPEDVECIIISTVTPDMHFPQTACLVQHKLGAKNAWGFDLSAACSSFVFGYVTACNLIESGRFKNVLLIGADKCTSFLNMEDRNTCVLFGDAAGAVLIEGKEDSNYGFIDCDLHIDGSGGKYLFMPAGGSLKPASLETVKNKEHYVFQEGREVFKRAVVKMPECTKAVLEKTGLSVEDIDWLVPHQANMRIIDSVAKRLKIDKEKVMINIYKYGNTTAATIPTCIDEYYTEGKLKKGQNVVITSFGAGFTWGAALLKWGI